MSVIEVAGGAVYSEIAAAASEYLALCGLAEVELEFCDEQSIRELNARTRGIDKVTDVLSYPALTLIAGRYEPFDGNTYPYDVNPDSGRVALGSIMICESVAESQAKEYGHSALREKGYLFLHGLLHLLGYDHIEENDRVIMRKAEEEILGAVGLGREEV